MKHSYSLFYVCLWFAGVTNAARDGDRGTEGNRSSWSDDPLQLAVQARHAILWYA